MNSADSGYGWPTLAWSASRAHPELGNYHWRSCVGISAVVLQLSARGAYPLLLGRPWLKTADIKQKWQKYFISFRRGKTKAWVLTHERTSTSKQLTTLYAEEINIMDRLADQEVDRYLAKNLRIVPLFEIDVAEAVTPYVANREEDIDELDKEAIREIRQAQEALEKEMAVSQRMKASTLEEVNLGTIEEPRSVNVAKEMPLKDKTMMVGLLKEFKDVFAWLTKI